MVAGFEAVSRLFKEYAGLSLRAVVGLTVALVLVGAAVGIVFPKFEATAVLQFPEPRNGQPVELTAFKRMSASYAVYPQLKSYVDARELLESLASSRLLVQSEMPAFWDSAARPVLPFSRRDQKEFGDIKDASAAILLGLDLRADARTEAVAAEMVMVLGGYFTNAVMRERIRSWVLAGHTDAVGAAKTLQADIVRAEVELQLLDRRVLDMQAILVKYPDTARMDARQVVSVSPNEGGERFLSPLAQLVGFESSISQRREQIKRWNRDLKQKQLLAGFFAGAEGVIDSYVLVDHMLPALSVLAAKTFGEASGSQEWVKEAALRVEGALANFEVTMGQFSLRGGLRVGAVPSRSPVRLALLLAALGLGTIAGIAVLRASFRGNRDEPTVA